MNKFKAYRIHSNSSQIHSGFEMLELNDLTSGNVIIKSIYSSINYKDALAATGQSKILKKSPLVGGIDVSGVVESSEDNRYQRGNKVFICGSGLSEVRDGGYAQYVRIPGQYIMKLPTGISLYEAMAIGTAGFTAALAIDQMQNNGQIPDQGPILVTGATGGVGSYAIDLLSNLGFKVIALTGKRNQADYLHGLGASEIVSPKALFMGDRALEKGLWAGAIDCVGGELLSWLTRTVQPLGNIAVIGLTGGISINTTVMPFILRGINLLGINSADSPPVLRKKIWHRLATDLKPQFINKIVTQEISFEQLPEMFDAYLQGQSIGRTVIKI
jgi:NADPH2:quinone reductase